MVTRGFQKRACAVLVNKVKNPIQLAREMLIRGGKDGSDGDLAGGIGGAQGHCCLGGKAAETLAKDWGLEMVDENYFWTRKRWDEHKKGLHESEEEKSVRQIEDIWPYSIRSHILLVGLAILQAPNSRATVSEISEWLLKKRPWLPGSPHDQRYIVDYTFKCDRESNRDEYVGSGKHFVEQRPQENEIQGPEPYWTIAPNKVSRFVEARDKGYVLLNNYQEEKEGKYRWPIFPEQDSRWDGEAYLPQGTVGCVALDQYGSM